MKNILLYLFMAFSPFFYNQSEEAESDNRFAPQYSVILSSEKGKATMNQCSRYTPANIDKYFDLTEDETVKLEYNFKKVLSEQVKDCCIKGWQVKNLEKYAYQYIGVVIGGKKYIYVNAFFAENHNDLLNKYKDWKSEPVSICDGGENFWGVLFDLEDKSFSQLAVNGVR